MHCLVVFLCAAIVVCANDEAFQDFINGNNLFTASVYKELSKKKDANFLVSPFSVGTILALTQSGCKGKTAEEIQNVLHLPNNKERIEACIKSVLPSMKNENYVLHTANKIYIKNNFRIKDNFRKIATEIYQCDLASIDFSREVEAANVINDWVEKQTENKIQHLIDPAIVNDDTRLILVNALYFKSNWSQKFESSLTKEKDFYKTEKDVLTIPTMHLYNKFLNYYESMKLNARFLELSFEGEDASMTIVLPNNKKGLSSLENHTEDVFAPQKFTSQLINLSLPKFTLQFSINFKEILTNLGINAAFNSETADLSETAGEKGELVINNVLQKSFIGVDEAGVEAAASTYIEFSARRLLPSIDFIVDHPFMFYIKIKNVILFAGRVTAPDL